MARFDTLRFDQMRMAKPMLLVALVIGCAAGSVGAEPAMTIRQALDKIQEHAGGPWKGPTVDTIKAGNPDAPVTGIVTTFTDSFDVLQRAAALGANLIISHEPSFYNHLDETKALVNDPVYQAKLAFIVEHKMVVFRFHDHWHSPVMVPDGILQGEIAALGWGKFHDTKDQMMFHLPETTLEQLAASMQQKMGIRTMRVIGARDMAVKAVAFVPGAAGAERQIEALERPDVEVLIVGEAREWETVEYVRDAMAEHRHKALIILGHVASEEAGMDYCATWLRQFLPGIPVTFVPAGEPFWRPGG